MGRSLRFVLDSVILIDHFNGIDQGTSFIAGHHSQIAFTVITRAELFALHHGLKLVTRNTRDFPPDRYDFVRVPYRI